jgi:hypothetical protein
MRLFANLRQERGAIGGNFKPFSVLAKSQADYNKISFSSDFMTPHAVAHFHA